MNKIRFWEVYDWKSIWAVVTIVFVVGGIFYFMENYPDLVRNGKASRLFKITDGNFEAIKSIKSMQQSMYTGNSIQDDYFEIRYSYRINDRIYSGSDKIPNSTSNRQFISKLRRGELHSLSIKYDPQNPEYSQIIIIN